MANANGGQSAILSGPVSPSRFVMVDTSRGYALYQASGGMVPVGVSQDGSKSPPGLIVALGGTESTVYAGLAGDQINVFRADDVCKLQAGAGGWNPGDLLKPDNDGKGVVASSGNWVGARALHAVAADALGEVVVIEATKA